MKIFFDHIAGNVSKRELVYAPATALFERDEYEYAIQNGWHIAESWGVEDFGWYNEQKSIGEQVWYQARSTRIDTRKFSERSRHRKRIKRAGVRCDVSKNDTDREQMWEVYQKYIESKGFVDFYESPDDLFVSLYGPRNYLKYYAGEKMIAFGMLEEVSKSVAVAPQFCWDYQNPQLGMGYINKLFQFRLMNDLGISHLYLGNSYESHSIGKSEYAGFEWWDGRKWSEDVELYKFILSRESKIESLDELQQLQEEYYSRI